MTIDKKCFHLELNQNTTTRGSLFWSRKVFEGVHSHVMGLLRKSDFGPFNFLFEIFDHVSKSNFGAIKIDRKCNFGAVIIRTRTKSANSINLKTHLKIIGRSNERFICSYYPRELYRVIRWAESSEISRPCW